MPEASPPAVPRRRARLVLAGLLTLGVAAGLASRLRVDLATPASSKLILDRHGRYLGEVPGEDGALGYWDLPGEIPERIRLATLETEDRFFYDHPGVHLPSVGRALWQDLRNLRVISGASTVAMQLARMQSPGARNLLRKAKEAAEALWLVYRFGHQRVLQQYLKLAPYGNRVHGVVRAARLYFDKPVEDLSWLQAAFLAGLPQRPGHLSPYHPDGLRRALARARLILTTLHQRGRLTQEELDQALASDLGIVQKPHRAAGALHAVLAWSEAARLRPEPVLSATLDLDVQATAVRVLRENLRHLRNLGVGNTAGMVVDSRRGDVLAYVGSSDYFAQEPRGAIDYVQTKRSPGSALKPFIYALGIEEQGYTAATELPDTPMEVLSEGFSYLPENMGHGYLGPLLLREALGNSRNIPALRVLADVGVERMVRMLERGGVRGLSWEPERYGLGLALGNLPVTLQELVGLYGVLAHHGQTLPLRHFLDDPPLPPARVLSRDVAQLVTHVLADPGARRPTFASGALDYDYAVAIKTGTSPGSRDAVAVGFSDRVLVGVWVGNHDWRPMNRVTGVRGAAGAVHELLDAVMSTYETHRSVTLNFPAPEGSVAQSVCALSGRLPGPECPNVRVEHFLPGTEPQEPCPFHRKLRVDRRNGLRAPPSCPPEFVHLQSALDLPRVYDSWARGHHLELAPRRVSPLCPTRADREAPQLTIVEPREGGRYLFDPDTPAAFATIRLVARVTPPDQDVVFLVDGTPVAQVGYPHEARWSLTPGTHTILAAAVNQEASSKPVTIHVVP